jgi:hypothetical protein
MWLNLNSCYILNVFVQVTSFDKLHRPLLNSSTTPTLLVKLSPKLASAAFRSIMPPPLAIEISYQQVTLTRKMERVLNSSLKNTNETFYSCHVTACQFHPDRTVLIQSACT